MPSLTALALAPLRYHVAEWRRDTREATLALLRELVLEPRHRGPPVHPGAAPPAAGALTLSAETWSGEGLVSGLTGPPLCFSLRHLRLIGLVQHAVDLDLPFG